MKIALIADTHFGCRSDSQVFLDQHRKFFEEVFFPTLSKEGINAVVHLGDLFDRGRTVNLNTLKQVNEFFFDKLEDKGIGTVIIPGNHDIYFKDTLSVNAPRQIIGNRFKHIEVVDKLKAIESYGKKLVFLPWVVQGEEPELPSGDILFAHSDMLGMEMYKGVINTETGLESQKLAKKFKLVVSGHYHHPSNKGIINMIGAPIEIIWSDFGGPRGFQILDLDDLSLEYIKNPNRVFRKVPYDDTNKTLETILKGDFSVFKDICIKIIVKSCNDRYILSQFIKKIEENNPFSVSIIESGEDNLLFEESSLDTEQSTTSIISDFIDGINTSVDKTKIKSMMSELYLEAENIMKLHQEI